MVKVKAQRKKSRRRTQGRGTLVAISALLVGSALIRLGDDAGQAFAKAPDATETQERSAAPEYAACETLDDYQPMLAAFRQREARITSQEVALQDRMQALKIANQEIERKLSELTAAEEALRDTIALADTAAESDLDRLTKVYENMKPKQAAALFEEMDPSFAAGFIGRMRPEAAAAVMAGLSPEAAHAYSVVLAGRNTNVPTE